MNHPIAFLLLLLCFLVLVIWLLPKIYRALKLMVTKLGQWLGLLEKPDPSLSNSKEHYLERLARLKQLLDQGALTEDEFHREKRLLLDPESD